jgi:hypothetical protein
MANRIGGSDIGVPLDEEGFGRDEQLALDGLGPIVGDRWRNRASGQVVAVIGTERRRQGWVTVRISGRPQTLRTATFERTFERI